MSATNSVFASLELSSGEFFATSFGLDQRGISLSKELELLQANELIVQESLFERIPGIKAVFDKQNALVLNRWADWLFEPERCRDCLYTHFGTSSLKGFGFDNESVPLISAVALLSYVLDHTGAPLSHIQTLTKYDDNLFLSSMNNTEKS